MAFFRLGDANASRVLVSYLHWFEKPYYLVRMRAGRRVLLVVLCVLVTGAGGCVWWFRKPLGDWCAGVAGLFRTSAAAQPKPDPVMYAALSADLERWRTELAQKHDCASSAEEKAGVEHDAAVLLAHVLPAMMRCWQGTPWDYNGTASKPGAGKIACGYFVSTVLMDAGFRVDRYQLAQQPSGNILRTFLEKPDCHLTTDQPYGQFVEEVVRSGTGVYLVGLDTHVGFLVVDGNGLRMIHSSGAKPWCVVDETSSDAQVLRKSSWRMFGNLTSNPGVVRLWLKGGNLRVHGASR